MTTRPLEYWNIGIYMQIRGGGEDLVPDGRKDGETHKSTYIGSVQLTDHIKFLIGHLHFIFVMTCKMLSAS
jgi:hypothetical protein